MVDHCDQGCLLCSTRTYSVGRQGLEPCTLGLKVVTRSSDGVPPRPTVSGNCHESRANDSGPGCVRTQPDAFGKTMLGECWVTERSQKFV
jgi:hypothetical protein